MISKHGMTFEEVMAELKTLGNEQVKRVLMNNGAQEPLFGVKIGSMKPLIKRIKKNRALSEELFNSGNYDAMYLAGLIAEPLKMIEEDFDRWLEKAYHHAIADYIVAVVLAKNPLAQKISDKWIASNRDIAMSAGWNCYCWLLSSKPNGEFDKDKLLVMLNIVGDNIHDMPSSTRRAMNNFIISMGVSFVPLHAEAFEIAKKVGEIRTPGEKQCLAVASAYIQKAIDKGRLGHKRRHLTSKAE